jgi:hypothetical protein
MPPKKLTGLPKAAAIAAIAVPLVGVLVGLLQWLKPATPSVQQSGATNVRGDVTASTGGVAMGPGSTINVVTPPIPPSKSDEQSLYLECRHSGLPTKAPGGRVHALLLWRTNVANGGSGLAEYFSLSDPPEFRWPRPANGLLEAQRCEITNYGQGAVFGIQLALQIEFRDVLVDKDRPGVSQSGPVNLSKPWIIYIARIDPGTDRAFNFYVSNMSEQFAQVGLPDSAVGQVLGWNELRQIRVIRPMMVPMMFSPYVEAKSEQTQAGTP